MRRGIIHPLLMIMSLTLSSCATSHVDFQRTDETVYRKQMIKPQQGVNIYSPEAQPPFKFKEFAIVTGTRDKGVPEESLRSQMMLTASSYRCDALIFKPKLSETLEASCVAYTQRCEQNWLMRAINLPLGFCDRIVDIEQ